MRRLTLFLLAFTAVFSIIRSTARAETVSAKDGISCLFEPSAGMPDGAMALLTQGNISELSWSDYNTPEGMQAWYISRSKVRISIAGFDGEGTTKMLTFTLTGQALLTIHAPSGDAGLKMTTLKGMCTKFGEGLW